MLALLNAVLYLSRDWKLAVKVSPHQFGAAVAPLIYVTVAHYLRWLQISGLPRQKSECYDFQKEDLQGNKAAYSWIFQTQHKVRTVTRSSTSLPCLLPWSQQMTRDILGRHSPLVHIHKGELKWLATTSPFADEVWSKWRPPPTGRHFHNVR